MTEWKPILQGRPTPGMQRLLGSARLDVPRPGGVARTVAALGLASGVTATAGASAASASTAGASVLVKWLAIGAATGAVVTGTGEAVRYGIADHETRTSAHKTVAAPATPAPISTAPRSTSFPDVPAAREADPSAATDPDPRSALSPLAQPPRPLDPERTRERAAPSSATTLAEEVRSLDAVRQLIAEGNARGALRSLDEYSRRFTQPRLGPEAALLREQARKLAQKP
jgi:hypothetical protein